MRSGVANFCFPMGTLFMLNCSVVLSVVKSKYLLLYIQNKKFWILHAVNGVMDGGRGPGRRKEGDRVAFEWNMDEGEGALSKLPRDA